MSLEVKEVRLHGKMEVDDVIYYLTSIIDFALKNNDVVSAVIKNDKKIKINCQIKKILIPFGDKTIKAKEVEKGYRGLVNLGQKIIQLDSLPDIEKGWDITDGDSIYLIIEARVAN